MIITYSSYLYLIIFLAILFISLVLYKDILFTKWIKKYWFFEKSNTFYIGKFFYILGFLILIFCLLDFRGEGENVETELREQKTVILIDTSSSMLVEDVRPNRFNKAIMMARHFVKKAFGHQIALVLFSDIQRKVVPFTDDLDLLDAKIAALQSLDITNGGSNITKAILEAVNYLKGSSNKLPSGNLLIFTDSEENGQFLSREIPDSIRIAIVGVGTSKGGPIPIRTKGGNFIGNKRYEGKEVVSKLDEEFLKRFGKNVKNYKYWIANSYSMPTESINEFFKRGFDSNSGSAQVKIRPVEGMNYIISGIILILLSQLIGLKSSFKFCIVFLLFFSFQTSSLKSQEKAPEEEKLPPLTEEVVRLLEKHKRGELLLQNMPYLAMELGKLKRVEYAEILYREFLTNTTDTENIIQKINYATLLLNQKKYSEGLEIFNELYNLNILDEKLKEIVSKNILFALAKRSQQNQQNKDKKNQKDKKDSGNDSKESQQKEEQENKQKESKENEKKDGKKDGENTEQKNQDDKNNQKNKEKKQEEKDFKKEQDNYKDAKSEQKEKGQSDLEKEMKKLNKEKMLEKYLKDIEMKKRKKVGPILKQLMGRDRELQKMYMDTTQKDDRNDQKKDW